MVNELRREADNDLVSRQEGCLEADLYDRPIPLQMILVQVAQGQIVDSSCQESQVVVPAVQWMIAGFPCTSMSSLNARAKHNRDCLRKRSAASGSVFGAIIDRMESQAGTLLAMTFENVPQITTGPPGASNLDTLIEVCSEVFCLDVVPWRLCPRDFGSPQS